MEKRELEHLERQIHELHAVTKALAEGEDYATMLRVIWKPGFTTPAEILVILGMVEAMTQQTRTLTSLRSALLAGMERVALNPQPLPPRTGG